MKEHVAQIRKLSDLLLRVAFCGEKVRMSFIFTVTSFVPPLLHIYSRDLTPLFLLLRHQNIGRTANYVNIIVCPIEYVMEWFAKIRYKMPLVWQDVFLISSVLSLRGSCDSANFMLIFQGGCVCLPSTFLMLTTLIHETELTVPCVYL